MNKSIEEVRKDTFEEFLQNRGDYYSYLNREFRVISKDCTEEFMCSICLRLFEFILYANYINSKIVVTKCDIDSRLLRNRSKYAISAKKLLSCLYNIRNAYAHSRYDVYSLLNTLKDTIRSISSIEDFRKILCLLLQINYPSNLDNLYFLVDRTEANTEYEELRKKIFTRYSDLSLNADKRTIKSLYDILSSEYSESLLSNMLILTLGGFYMVS